MLVLRLIVWKSWKHPKWQPKGLTIEGWLNERQHIQLVEYYAATAGEYHKDQAATQKRLLVIYQVKRPHTN